MKNSSMDDDDLLTELNDTKMRLLIPVIVYITLLMISGIIGNSMVCYYYGLKTRLTTNTFFIIVLAVYDLLACAVAMPTEIVDMVRYYKFDSGAACKILSFVNYVSAMGSAFTLVVIALDRYNRIKQIHKRHMEIRHARIATVIIALLTFVLSWPAFLLYDAVTVEVPNDYGRILVGQDCTSIQTESAEPYLWAFSIIHFAVFFICSGALILFYTVIGKTIFKHRRNLKRYTCCEAETVSSCKESYIQSDGDDNSKPDSNTRGISGSDDHPQQASPNKSNFRDSRMEISIARESETEFRSNGTTLSTNSPRKSKADLESVKITILMLAVTVLFIVSFLPAISLIAWKTAGGDTDSLSSAGLVWYKLGARSYMLNSSLNPWIYGIFNSKFRQYFARKLCFFRRN